MTLSSLKPALLQDVNEFDMERFQLISPDLTLSDLFTEKPKITTGTGNGEK